MDGAVGVVHLLQGIAIQRRVGWEDLWDSPVHRCMVRGDLAMGQYQRGCPGDSECADDSVSEEFEVLGDRADGGEPSLGCELA